MLESPLQVAVIGPASTREEAGKIVQAAVARWLTVKDRRKLARELKEETRTQPALIQQRQDVRLKQLSLLTSVKIREEIQATVNSLAAEGIREEN